MIINVYEDLDTFEEFEFKADNMKDILSGIKMIKGQEYSDNILQTKYQFILTSNDKAIFPISLNKDSFLSNLTGYDNLFLFPDISGELPAAFIPLIWAAAVETATAIGIEAGAAVLIGEAAVMAAEAVVAIGVSMALNGLMQLISPTTSFSSDPAQAQQMQSSLFNGAPLIREQGGSVPLWYGSSYIGGVLISSSISTAEG
ncbi:COG4723 Phage-related protein, tail component [uncultured Caudovirales phage]|uniref:COG4723 Phage-related protein, tail component n=1 Tax=uncultured Caudovirales phage TaxID=2100421 RepID=A0A6J5PI34_9CAUD|nr:COG4723 Phage-related protein, tail component [uncultured Caudovirales phage]